eukprot:721576-Rhodomonas_salina.1
MQQLAHTLQANKVCPKSAQCLKVPPSRWSPPLPFDARFLPTQRLDHWLLPSFPGSLSLNPRSFVSFRPPSQMFMSTAGESYSEALKRSIAVSAVPPVHCDDEDFLILVRT